MARLTVLRYEERSRFRYARPRGHFDHGCDRSTAGRCLDLAKALTEAVLELVALGLDELQLPPGLLGQLDELEAKRPHRCR